MKTLIKGFLLVLCLLFSAGCAAQTLHSSDEVNVNDLKKEGAQLFEEGKTDAALDVYKKALEIAPRDSEAYLMRGKVYTSGKGNHLQALSDIDKSIEIDPQYAEAYYQRGVVHKRMGKIEDALADYDRAIALNPRYAEAYINRGTIYGRDLKKYDRAIADFDQAIRINPKLEEAYLNKGLAHEKAGQDRNAIQAYKAFIQNVRPQYEQFIEYAQQRIETLEKKLAAPKAMTKH